MKIAVFGDRHVSMKHPRFDESLRLWDIAISEAIAHNVDGFLCLGDVGEVGMTPAEIYEIGLRYKRMRSQGWVCEVEGNHGVRLGLRWAELLGVTVADDEWRVFTAPSKTFQIYGTPADDADSSVCFLLAPYCRRGFPPYQYADGDLTEAYAVAAESLRMRIAELAEAVHQTPGSVLIVAGHWTPAGFRVGPSEFEQTGGKEMIVPVSALAPADLVLVGHIHEAQALENIVGVGSMFRTTFGERDQEKSYTLVTISDDLSLGRDRISWERYLLPARSMKEVHISGAQASETVAAILADPQPQDVKLVIEVAQGDQTVYADIVAPLAQAPGHFPWEVIKASVSRARAPEIEQSITLADDFGIWLAATHPEISDETRARVLEKVEAI